ncbi:MAG: hypothetical protein R6X02_09170 [Enhygromyxa sp.]
MADRRTLGRALAVGWLATACAATPVDRRDPSDEPEALPNSARAISETPRQLCVLYDQGQIWCRDGQTERHVELGATGIVAVSVEGYGGRRYALSCALTGEGRVVCWDEAWEFSVIPDVYEAVEITAGRGGVCASTRGGEVACFDQARIPRWVDGSGALPTTGVDFSIELSARCVLSEDRRVLCPVMDEQQHAATAELEPDPSSIPLRPEQLGLDFTPDPWERWAGLRKADFATAVAALAPAERRALALRLLAPEPLRCLVREDSNSLHHWPTPDDSASIHDGCWRRELFGWALEQLSPAELGERIDALLETIEVFDYLRWEALASVAERLEPAARLRLAERLLPHPRLCDSVVATLEAPQLSEALARGMDAAIGHMSLPKHAVELRAAASDPRLAREHRLAALESFTDPLDEQLMRELVDDRDCAVAMRAATVLAEAGLVDRRPRIDRTRDLSFDELADRLCRASWEPSYAVTQHELLLRGQSVALFRSHAESDAEPQPKGEFTAADALTKIDRYECETEGATATCRFWPERSYEVDPDAPEFDLVAASAWSYWELRFVRSKRDLRLVEVHEVHGTDCTNC